MKRVALPKTTARVGVRMSIEEVLAAEKADAVTNSEIAQSEFMGIGWTECCICKALGYPTGSHVNDSFYPIIYVLAR